MAESISSNIFIVKKNEIFTRIVRWMHSGIMRQVVIELARDLGFKVYEDVALNTKVFATCDELFLTNAISGIRWVLGLGGYRYFNTVSKRLSSELNRVTFKGLV